MGASTLFASSLTPSAFLVHVGHCERETVLCAVLEEREARVLRGEDEGGIDACVGVECGQGVCAGRKSGSYVFVRSVAVVEGDVELRGGGLPDRDLCFFCFALARGWVLEERECTALEACAEVWAETYAGYCWGLRKCVALIFCDFL